MHITMVGTGYVGLVSGVCFADTGNHVTCLDIDPAKIDRLRRGESPIYEPGLDELLQRNLRAERLTFTTDKQQAYRAAEVIFLCVGTPTDPSTGEADLQYIFAAAEDIGRAIAAADGPPKIVVVKSTVPVGSNTRIERAIAGQTDRPFHMASNPEFLKEGAAINDFFHPDRVVLGVHDAEVGQTLSHLYMPYVRQANMIFLMDVRSAEMVKYAANCMLATKISFINEIANLCEAYAADVDEVRRGMCSDRRIGNQFFYPGLGYGGSCFPKDVQACIAMGEQSEYPASLMQQVHAVNQRQRQRFIQRILDHFDNRLAGRRIAVWGIAFKPGTDDIREAPAIDIIRALLAGGAEVVAYDPKAVEHARAVFGEQVTFVDDEMAALDNADGLVVCTNWTEFLRPDFDEMKQRLNAPLIFDGRNLYEPALMRKLGFTYVSIGRPTVQPPAIRKVG